MGWLSKPKAPPAPNYEAAAVKTAASNQQAQTSTDWANRPDQVDMYGNKTSWQASPTYDPATGQTVNKWTQSTTLSPQQQQALNSQMALQQGLTGTAQGMLGRAQEAVSNPFDWGGLQAMGSTPQAGNLQAGYLSPGQQIQATNTQAGNLDPSQYQTQGAGQGIMAGLNMGSLGSMPVADAQERQRIENSLFERMAPQHQRAQAGLEGKLANMGLTRGSAAWNREAQRLGDQQSRDRFGALEMGGNEMQRLYGMQMQGRQQGWNELQGAGQFQNAAQNQAMQQMLAQNQQNFGQQATAGAQNFDQQARAAAQNFGQQSQSANDWLNRQAQAGAQNFGQQQQAGQQNYNQQMQSANYQNQLRQQQIAEQQLQRQMPLNELNAFMSGNQVSNPNFANFNQSQNTGGVDYSGAAQNQYNAGMNAYNAQQQQGQGLMSGLGGIANLGIKAFGAGMFSDVRLKSNIVRIGDHPIGVGIYEYDIFGRRERGVLAQELLHVAPQHVYTHSSGYLMVDYGSL